VPDRASLVITCNGHSLRWLAVESVTDLTQCPLLTGGSSRYQFVCQLVESGLNTNTGRESRKGAGNSTLPTLCGLGVLISNGGTGH
jgi:hypothetical protein